MGRALHNSATQAQESGAEKLDWRKRISDHVAYGLLFYTGLQIFVTMTVLKQNSTTILPYLALVILVFAIIPGCRLFEARWSELSDEAAADPSLAGAYRRDRAIIWGFAVLAPLVLAGAIRSISKLLV